MLFLYTRVSSTEQAADDKSSLENQERIGRGYAMSKGFNQFDVSCYVDPGVSASIPLSKRPAGGQMLADAKAGDTIFAAKLDRMFRSASDALNMVEIFKEKNINLVLFDLGTEPINSSGIAQFFFTVIAAVAQLERTMIRERCVNGKRAKKEKGGHTDGLAPYGFRVVGRGRASMLVPVPEEQQVLEQIDGLLEEDQSLSSAEIARRLTKAGVVSRNGQPFYEQKIHRIVQRAKQAMDARDCIQ